MVEILLIRQKPVIPQSINKLSFKTNVLLIYLKNNKKYIFINIYKISTLFMSSRKLIGEYWDFMN